MTTQEVMEDFSLPLNPVLITCANEASSLKAWSIDHKLLLVSIVHLQDPTSPSSGNQELSLEEPNWEDISRKLKPELDEQETAEFFSPKECKKQYDYLMSTVDVESSVEKDGEVKLLQKIISDKQKILIKTLAEERVRVSQEREKGLREEIDKVGKRILYLNTIGLQQGSLSDMSDSGGTDSENEETVEMAHPFEDGESLMERLNRAFNMTEDSLLSPPVASNLAVAVDPSTALISEALRSSSPPTYSTMEFKKGSATSQAVSPQLKNLVHSAIAGAAQEDKTKIISPTSAPTLSMLLEMPPRDRGQPLPQIQSLMGTTSAANVDSLTGRQAIFNTINLESPTKGNTALGISLSPIKTNPENPGRRDGAGLPGLTLSMPLKTQEEIEIANDFVISSGLVQEVAETYELVQGLPNQTMAFREENAESPKCTSVLSSSSQSIKLSEDIITDPLAVPIDSMDIDNSVKTQGVPLVEVSDAGINIAESNSFKVSSPLKISSEVAGVDQIELPTPQNQETLAEIPCVIDILKTPGASEAITPSVDGIMVEREFSILNHNVPEDKEKAVEQPCEILSEELVLSTVGSPEKKKNDDSKASDSDVPKGDTTDVFDIKDKSKSGSGRGKKPLHEKPEDTASAPLTRNSIREKGVKLEEAPLVVKKVIKDIPTTPSTVISRRSITRAGASDEGKPESKPTADTPLSPNKVYGTGLRKPIPKVTEPHTPNLRSRRGPTPTPMSIPGESGSGKLLSIKKESDVEVEAKERGDSDSSSPHKEVIIIEKDRMSPRKLTTEKEKLKEILTKSEDESNGEQSDVAGDEDSRAMSGFDDESCDNEEMSKKKRFRASPRKERSESGEMADDDNSNSAFDGNQKKRLTRRSAKISPQKSDGKSRDNSADGNSSKDPDASSSKDNKSRQSKSMSRLKHLNEDAQQHFGDIEMKEEDGNGKRVTRARAKTSTSPGGKGKSVGSSKISTNTAGEQEASSEAERGPSRATRSRAAATTGGAGTSHSVMESLPSAPLDSNPSSPSSSTTNSTILDEDRDQRAFRKSIMLIWNQIAAHRFASVFMKPITDEAVPGYSKKVKRPMDLLTIKRNIETGAIRAATTFERDLYLMFLNAVMFNPITHSIVSMAKVMECDTAAILEDYKLTQKLVKSSQDGEGSNKKDDSDADQEPQEEEKPKSSTVKVAGRKRRNRSTSVGNSDEPVEGKRRTLRTSTTAATTAASAWQGSRKGKNQTSPDIISSGRTE